MTLRDRLLMGGVLLYSLSISNLVVAQVIPDDTTSTNVGACGTQCLVRGGTIRGSNLFHSFQELNVASGQQVRFASPNGISNILSRVTGDNDSNIEGTLGVNGGANLFLLNPNGIIFGPSARLDIRGSFIATTAESFVFPDGSEFSAVNSQPPPLLAIHTPTGLQIGAIPGSITNQSRADIEVDKDGFPVSGGLQLPSGQTLALIGGPIAFQGGLVTAPEGQVELGSVAGGNLVTLRETETGFGFSYEGISRFQDIQFSRALIDASGNRAGSIHLQGRTITLSDASTVGSTTTREQGGDLLIHASDSVSLGGDTAFLTSTSGSGSAGDVVVLTQRLTVEQGAFIASVSGSEGHAGDISITTLDEIKLLGTNANGLPSSIGSQTYGRGNSGDVTVETGRLLIQDGAILDTSTFGAGNAGDITVIADESITLIGDSFVQGNYSASGIRAQVGIGRNPNPGDAGDIRITTQRLVVLDGAQVSTVGRQRGNAGSLTVNASDSIQLSGFSTIRPTNEDKRSGLFVSAEPRSNSLAGDLNVTTQRLVIENEARISADNFGSGLRAGNVNLNVQELILNRGDINALTRTGEGANIVLQASDLLSLNNQSRITAEARNNANGGNIVIASGRIVAAPFEDSDIVASAIQGNGGVILITTQDISGIEERRAIEGNGTNDIDASSEFGTSGAVIINSTDLGGVELPATPATTQLAQACGGGDIALTSRFISSGRSGLPTNPYEPLSSSTVLDDVLPPESLAGSSNSSSYLSDVGAIAEAQGWLMNEQGEIVLIAEAIDLTASSSCQVP